MQKWWLRALLALARTNFERANSVRILLAIVILATASPVFAVNVSVDPNNVRAIMPLEGLGIGTAVYDNQFGNANLASRLNEAGVTTLRYSGGGYADVYHWSVHQDVPFGGISDKGYVASGTSFPGLLNIMNNMGNGQAVITIDYGSALKLNGSSTVAPDFGGQPQEAAAWVAYANADPSIYGTSADVPLGVDQQGNNWQTAGYWAKLRASTPAQYQAWATADGKLNPLNSFLAINRNAGAGIKYWEIGNETFGTGYYGGGNGYSTDYHQIYDGTNRDGNPNLSPAHYGQQVVQFSNLMKAVDPSIKIGAVLNTPPDDYTWDLKNGQHWNDQVLSQPGIASAVDFAMVHWYPNAGNNANGTSLLAAVRTTIPQMINGATTGIDTGTSAGIRDSFATWGLPNAEIMVTEFNYMGSLSNSVTNAVNDLFVADSYASWLENGITSIQYLEMNKNTFIGDASGLTRGAAFYAIKMLNMAEDPGDSAVSSTSDTLTVRVHSYKRADGSVAVMLLNEGTGPATINVSIAGSLLDTSGMLYSSTGTGITTSSVSGLGNRFTVGGMPARTLYTFIIPPAAVPEPSSVVLCLLGATLLTGAKRRKRNAGNGNRQRL
jgi:hypothetical protein